VGLNLNETHYADEMSLLGDNRYYKEKYGSYNYAGKETGPEINAKKTKYM
jgi:hypothetical protein